MVFLTTRLWLRNRLTDRYCRVWEVLKHAQHFRGRKNRCYRLAVRAVTRAFVKCTQARRLKKRNLRTLWTNRITAASQEHGLQYPAFIVNLIKIHPSAVAEPEEELEGLRTKGSGLNRAVMLCV
ncbi:large ribosomal subunit protein bL20m isoform X2 [Peromyscus maniculatus bairdii]|uniref:large ribosomal subunit protein bL20m isoform X2 n=1 Tax=Peromyscus maniculatus bairdii TaxID=230844 RepID=UPI003FD1369D